MRFIREQLRPGSYSIDQIPGEYRRNGDVLAADVYRPAGVRRALPGWLVLHGLTAVGRKHEGLMGFARAMAASGAVVMVPDIPEWRQLHVAASVTVPTIRAAIHALAERADVESDRVGIIGFSFGATQAIVAAADPGVQRILQGIAAWGGYHELHRLFRFGITGTHELDGRTYHIDPDPYGRWFMGGNYLTGIPGCEEYTASQDALLQLATAAGQRRVFAWDASFDPLKLELRGTLPREQQPMFDLFAPLTTQPIADRERAEFIAYELANAALRAEPLLDPAAAISALRVPTLVAHGRDDRLVPFSESVQLARALPPDALVNLTITALFAHSGGTQVGLSLYERGREGLRFVRLLDRIVDLI